MRIYIGNESLGGPDAAWSRDPSLRTIVLKDGNSLDLQNVGESFLSTGRKNITKHADLSTFFDF